MKLKYAKTLCRLTLFMQTAMIIQGVLTLRKASFSKCKDNKIMETKISSNSVKSVSQCADLCTRECCAGFNMKQSTNHLYTCDLFSRIMESCQNVNIASQIGTNVFILCVYYLLQNYLNQLNDLTQHSSTDFSSSLKHDTECCLMNQVKSGT